MFKTIYKLRLLVEESSQYYPVHLYALKEKEPTFNELYKKVQRLTENLNLDDYYLATVDTKQTLYDDISLQTILKSAADQQHLEIILCRSKSDRKDDLHNKKMIHLQPAVPIIKPTVLRWTTPEPNHHIRRFSSISQDTDIHRKDSGISLDEPCRKKQRVMSAEIHARKLHDLSPLMLPSIVNLHPLEIRRPSTAPSPTLPAISSLTSQCHPLDAQLAPIKKQGRPSHGSIFLCEHVHEGKMCGQTFRRSYDLSRHQTIHMENRPFCYCEQCGKKFTRMDALRRHERVQGHHSQQKHRSMSTPHWLEFKTVQQRKTSV